MIYLLPAAIVYLWWITSHRRKIAAEEMRCFIVSKIPRKNASGSVLRIVERYRDFEVIGNWGTWDPSTGKESTGGKMLAETVKVQLFNGDVELVRRWVPDNEKDEAPGLDEFE